MTDNFFPILYFSAVLPRCSSPDSAHRTWWPDDVSFRPSVYNVPGCLRNEQFSANYDLCMFLPSALCLCPKVSQHNLDIKSFLRYKYNLRRGKICA